MNRSDTLCWRKLRRNCAILAVALLPVVAQAQILPRHDLKVVLEPQAHHLQAEDRITIPGSAERRLRFSLHGGLHAVSATPGVKVEQACETESHDQQGLDYYIAVLPAGITSFTVRYAGVINHPPEQERSETRTFEITPGVISADGVFLAGASNWYPQFDDGNFHFSLEAQLPVGWEAVSQGARTRHAQDKAGAESRWESPEPQNQIYLVAGKLREYLRAAGKVEAQVFLRSPDDALAARYLDATVRYLALYEKLLGPYPYKKFALVENFWETGYGMPSFTLLGSQVIRFPFILNSSYPHEILHNWWGTGVFVDYESGNWSEGLTSYLADYLLQEQQGNGADYRRGVLQKYGDYVSTNQDFPAREFTSRHSSATEAVGYGKVMMFFHMLRRELGDETFLQGLRAFYRDQLFRRAGFVDLQAAFSKASGHDLAGLFEQWINRAGAPELRVSQVVARPVDGGFRLRTVLEQSQDGPAYRLTVPLAVTIAGQPEAFETTVVMTGKRLTLDLPVAGRPLRLDVDPEFDLFRRLSRDETPPALSQPLGAEKTVIVLPGAASPAMQQQYRKVAESWAQQPGRNVIVFWDSELDRLPGGAAIWLFGWENRFAPQLAQQFASMGIILTDKDIRLGGTNYTRAEHSVVLTTRHPDDPMAALGWFAAVNEASVPGLARKLPHYGRYGYVVFNGDEPRNVGKGMGAALRSPLSVVVLQPEGGEVDTPRAQLKLKPLLAGGVP